MEQGVSKALQDRKQAIVKRWFEKALEAYPDNSSAFLRNTKKQFANPVGFTLAESLEALFDLLIGDFPTDRISASLDSVVRIRAVQGLKPSESLAFFLHLKEIVRLEMQASPSEKPLDLSPLEDRIEAMTLLAFDKYMQCREKIYELQANEVRNMTYRLLQRANLVCEYPGQ
jgi:hypothetical protein